MPSDYAISYGDAWAAEHHSQELSLRINSLCAELRPEHLLATIAAELVQDLSLHDAAFYRTAEPTDRADSALSGVHLVTHAHSTPPAIRDDKARRAQAIATRAARTNQIQLRPARSRRESEHDGDFVLALPLAEPIERNILVVSGPDQRREHIRESLMGALGALQTAVRLAALAQRLEHAGQRNADLATLLTLSSEAILTVDHTFHILDANPASAAMFGWSAKSPIGKHCSEVLVCHSEQGHLLCRTDGCPLARAFAAGEGGAQGALAPSRDLKWQTSLGTYRDVSASFSSIVDAAEPRALIVARDMTPLNDADRMRAHFISMVSHELRTPTNSINGFLEIVLEGHVGSLNERQIEFLNYARSSTQQLMTLVEDTLFLSRADTGQFKLRFDTVVVPDLVAQVVKSCQAAAQQAGVELRLRLPEEVPHLHADELRLHQVLTNLIHNAINFTPPHGHITVQVEIWPHDLCFDVCDTGTGVPLEEQHRIFDRFYQSPTPGRGRVGGYGLGLAIAKLIVQLHGGRIWVASAPPDGATFSFTIPLSLESHRASQTGDAHRASAASQADPLLHSD